MPKNSKSTYDFTEDETAFILKTIKKMIKKGKNANSSSRD